ncbi:MAG: OprO/OprP family phosphate-selective porin, partial [Candidatus Eiseniibacteriota bacterium]
TLRRRLAMGAGGVLAMGAGGALACVTLLTAVLALLVMTAPARAQGSSEQPASVDTTNEASEPGPDASKRRWTKFNQFDGPVSTFRYGYGFLVDFASYSQDAEAKQQAKAESDAGLRDFRLLFGGSFKTKRPFSWTLGYMYDGAASEWRFRKTGFLIGIPEASGSVFIGRDKEGYSLNKIMVGYDGWTVERSTAMDAFVPILADGIKYFGYSPRTHLIWNIGAYWDVLSKNESFSTYQNQVVGRLGWVPVLSEPKGEVVHIAIMSRDGVPEDHLLKIRSRPESYLAPYFVDTGQFPATHSTTNGIEAYYRKGPWLYGTEYNFVHVDASTVGNPNVNGGDAVVLWNITGETRPYNPNTATFRSVSPKRTVFEGGPGAWEAVLRYSYIDLDDGGLKGGKFWRITPMVNWHLSDNFRMDLAYGYGTLDRYSTKGKTQFYQLRLQTSL